MIGFDKLMIINRWAFYLVVKLNVTLAFFLLQSLLKSHIG